MTPFSNFAPILAAALCPFALGCGGRAASRDPQTEETPEKPAVGSAVQEAVDGLANAYRALCACEAARSIDGSCDAKEEFEGYDPDAVREALERGAERGDGFTECIRDIVQPLSACLSAEGGCDYGVCPHAGALLDDNMVLEELGEACPRQRQFP
jgi:hypothetical protein